MRLGVTITYFVWAAWELLQMALRRRSARAFVEFARVLRSRAGR